MCIYIYMHIEREREIERDRTQNKRLYICIYIYTAHWFHLKMIETVPGGLSQSLVIHPSLQPWSEGQCTLSQLSGSAGFNLNRIESIWTERFDPVLCLAAPLAYSDRVEFQSALRVEIVAKNATFKNVWSLCEFTRNQLWWKTYLLMFVFWLCGLPLYFGLPPYGF